LRGLHAIHACLLLVSEWMGLFQEMCSDSHLLQRNCNDVQWK
jgi:hypothetical protein